MTFIEFLDKETPGDGGCMVCLATYKQGLIQKTEYLLIERKKVASGDMFLVNKRFFYDYDFAYDDKVKDWEILYKKVI